ncbi:MAG: anthranilate phosphoribosyltransferase [Gammaproteobacteria bacterium]|jgi:anthranilate phosphoribosyltransferase
MTYLPENVLRSAIQKVATGPEYSKDLDYEEALNTMEYILSGNADPVQTGIFLIAMRMKRETMEENCGILQALKNHSPTVEVNVEDLVDLSDPYDGYIRGVPASPFLPSVLAATGYATVSHGVQRLGPKFGVTHRRILKAAGKNVELEPAQVKTNLEDNSIGWSYIDQSRYCPIVHDLIELRQRMVKRQVLTTVEVLAQPLRATGITHIMTGYVHKAYPPIYANLARHAGFDNMVLIRGVEGGIVPSLKQPGRFFRYINRGEESQVDLNPLDLGFEQTTRNVPLPAEIKDIEDNNSEERLDELAIIAAKMGISALKGQLGASRNSLIYSGAIMLHCLNNNSLQASAEEIRQVLDSGKALEHFNQHL